jgi:hypothetical protein
MSDDDDVASCYKDICSDRDRETHKFNTYRLLKYSKNYVGAYSCSCQLELAKLAHSSRITELY